ncbi:MAG: hypothetical protein MRERV_75c005 [Mycoplasmataceae bacterium RV_VA103A]|nr:MAG: hypothetical protein MRERV_75c005 [Mycoplasmataceae bacterium RV_VA103A]
MKEADLIYWKKGRFSMSSGKIIIIEMDIWLVSGPKRHLYPDGLKFGWIAVNKDNCEEKILVDYNPKKGFHYHIDNQPIIKLEWIFLVEAFKFFYEKVHEKFGDFKN